MKIHKEGYKIILVSFLLFASICLGFWFISSLVWLNCAICTALGILFLLIVWFFRYPKREVINPSDDVLCPADGTIVIIEEVEEPEYFKDKRLQVSIFMSPLNVHVNRYAVGGEIVYTKYHPGKYLVAWAPKSSLINERATIVVRTDTGKEVLIRQIAGFIARRIVTYSKVGDKVKQGNDLGFIKFGSRVDLFLPLNADIKVKIGDKVKGNITVIAQ